MKKLIGISTFTLQSLYGDIRALEIANEIGADAVDFSIDSQSCAKPESIYSKSDDEITAYYKTVKEKADELGLIISQTHGRLRIYWGEEEKNITALKDARIDCMVTKTLGAPYTVMHSIATSITGPDADPVFMHDLCYDTIDTILGYAKQYDVMLAVETMGDAPVYGCCDFFGYFTEFKKSFERLYLNSANADRLVCCIDTGHVNKAYRFEGNPPPAEFIRGMGSAVRCLHLNDNNKLTDQHKIPMTGDIDWKDVLKALDEVGYDGIYNLELNLKNFGPGFEIQSAKFAVELMNFILNGTK